MSLVRRFFRAINPALRGRQAARARALEAENLRLREELRGAANAVALLTGRVTSMQAQLARLTALSDDVQQAARLDRLALSLDREGLAAHVAGAIAASRPASPQAHELLRIDAPLPAEVAAALRSSIPAPVFFRTAPTGERVLPLPPKLAPADAVAAGGFLAAVAAEVILPALLARFAIATDGAAVVPEIWVMAGADLATAAAVTSVPVGRPILLLPLGEDGQGTVPPAVAWHGTVSDAIWRPLMPPDGYVLVLRAAAPAVSRGAPTLG